MEFEERWVLFVGLAIVGSGSGGGGGGFIVDESVFVFGLLRVLLIMLSTANGDVVILGDGEPVSASFKKDPARDFSDGTFVANCCCLDWLLDDVDDDVGRWDTDGSLFEVAGGWELSFNESLECFLYWENKSIEKSIAAEEEVDEFCVWLRFVDESEDCEDGETTPDLAMGRITSNLFVLCDDSSVN